MKPIHDFTLNPALTKPRVRRPSPSACSSSHTLARNYVQTHPQLPSHTFITAFPQCHTWLDMALHAQCTAAHFPINIWSNFSRKSEFILRFFFFYLKSDAHILSLPANEGVTANVQFVCSCCEMFLSISWGVGTLYFSKYIYEKGSVYLNTVYAYVIVYCTVIRSKCSGFVVFWACLHRLVPSRTWWNK